MAQVRLQIQGREGEISARSLLTALDSELNLLAELDRGISGKKRGTLEWRVVDLSMGSIAHALDSFTEDVESQTGPQVASGFVRTLRLLESGDGTPPYLSERGMNEARRLVQLVGRGGVTGLIAETPTETAKITARASANVRRLLTVRYWAIGSIEGTIETVSLRRQPPRFMIYDALTGKAVTCFLDRDEKLEEVRELLAERVNVAGQIAYNGLDEPIRMKVIDLRRLRRRDELPNFRDLAGSDPDFTGGVRTAEYVGAMRDD